MRVQTRSQSRAEAREALLTTYGWSFHPAEDGFDLHLHFHRRHSRSAAIVILLVLGAILVWPLLNMAGPTLRILASGQVPHGAEWFAVFMSGLFLVPLLGVLCTPRARRAVGMVVRGARTIQFRYEGHSTSDCLLTTAPTDLQIISDPKGTTLRAIQCAQMVEIARFGGPYPAERLAAELQARCPSFKLARIY